MTNLELYKLMRQIVLLVTNCPNVIKSNPNATAPGGEYCAISVTQPKRRRGHAITKRTNTDPVISPIGDVRNINYAVYRQVIADVSINFYRGDAHEYAELLFDANKRPDVHELLFRAGVGWNGSGPINNLNALQSENWEDRAQITIRVMYEKTDNVDNNAIYQVPVEVEDFDSGEIIYSDTIVSPNP